MQPRRSRHLAGVTVGPVIDPAGGSKPLLDDQGRRLENFTRVETFGDDAVNGLNDVQWVKVLVDPKSRDVFAFQPQIVPANRVAVPPA